MPNEMLRTSSTLHAAQHLLLWQTLKRMRALVIVELKEHQITNDLQTSLYQVNMP